jgi:hypothetical protein
MVAKTVAVELMVMPHEREEVLGIYGDLLSPQQQEHIRNAPPHSMIRFGLEVVRHENCRLASYTVVVNVL